MKNTFDLVKKLEFKINSMLSSSSGDALIKFYVDRFDIPEEVCSQYIKQRIASNYSIKFSKFNHLMNLSYMLVSIFKHYIFMIFILFLSKKLIKKEKDYTLLIDDMQHKNEFDRWSSLEEIFTSKETAYIVKSSIVDLPEKKNIINHKIMHGYDRSNILSKGLKMFTSDIIFLISSSFKFNMNLIHMHSYFTNDYFYYDSLFKVVKAKYLIQDRNLGGTNALKNYLFKLSGGVASSCVQKNIVQHNGHALFYDTDIFFSYGNKTAEDIMSLSARIDHLHPVGSFAMDNALLQPNSSSVKNDIDILYIGINAITSDKTDWSGYYKSINWLVELANRNLNLNIVIKHHPSWISDPKESFIIKGSKIKYLDKKIDSYEVARKSTYIITYGSSMGYELTGYNLNVIFIDPDYDNPFINSFVHQDKNVVHEYKDLELLVNNETIFQQKKNRIKNINYCYPHKEISKSIHKYLVTYGR